MRPALLVSLGLTLAGCDKQSTPPTTADGATPIAADAAESPAANTPLVERAAEPEDANPAADDGSTADADGGAGEDVATAPQADAPAEGSDPPPAAAPAPLPKPRYTSVDDSCGKDPGVGQKLKAFELPGVDGKKMTHRSWGDRVLLVNFWGTWCKPCLEELPEFAGLYRRYRKHGLTLVAIATDEDPAAVKEVLAKSKIAAKVAVAGEDYAGKYGSPKFPFTFVVDPSGTIKSSFRGFEPKCMGKIEADLRAELEKRNAG